MMSRDVYKRQDYINPLDINTNYSEEENPLTLKSDFILSMCELIVGGKDGLQPVEKTICLLYTSFQTGNSLLRQSR